MLPSSLTTSVEYVVCPTEDSDVLMSSVYSCYCAQQKKIRACSCGLYIVVHVLAGRGGRGWMPGQVRSLKGTVARDFWPLVFL
jgi:hypothetical protein